MSRRLVINFHLYLAAFFAPMLVIIAISGGLYLLGIKGSTDRADVMLPAKVTLDLSSATLEADVRKMFKESGIDYQFEYIKINERKVFTRPTSKTSYEIRISKARGQVTLTKLEPDIQKRMIELHKGHGPSLFKHLQKFMALGLLIILLSGLYLGIVSKAMKVPTLVTTSVGLLTFIIIGLVI